MLVAAWRLLSDELSEGSAVMDDALLVREGALLLPDDVAAWTCWAMACVVTLMEILLGIRGRNVEGAAPVVVDAISSIEAVDDTDVFEGMVASTMACKGAADDDEAASWSAKKEIGRAHV